MKALSIKPIYAMDIALGFKTREYRSWKTDHRGPLLICSSKSPSASCTIPGHAICVVDIVDIEKNGRNGYAWILENPIPIKPVPVKGQLNLYEVNDDLIKKAPFNKDTSDEEKETWLNENFYPMMEDVEQRKDGRWQITQEAKDKYGYDVNDVFPY